MVEIKLIYFIFSCLLFLLLIFQNISAQEDLMCNDTCVPTNSSCIISCGQTIRGQSTGTVDYFNYTVTSGLTQVNIEVNASNPLTDYDLHANWIAGECPSGFGDGCTDGGESGTDICRQNITAGTYIVSVAYDTGPVAKYNISLTCKSIMEKPTISYPENKIYYNTTVNLTTKCVGVYPSYDINRSLDEGENVTCGFSIANNTEYTNTSTLSNLEEGNHNVTVTCYNGIVSTWSDIVFFNVVIPKYDLNTWVSGPSLFTIGRTELVNVYVRNTGNMIDNFNISFRKQTVGEFPEHLIDVSMLSDRIVSLGPGKVGDTFAKVTLIGPISSGSIIFNVTSETNSSISYLTQPIEIRAGLPMNLPEFELFGVLQLLVVTSFIMIIYSSRRKKQNL